MKALHQNKTWSLVPIKFDMNIVGSKWVFKTKFKADGIIERHKARLATKGYNQIKGVDFDETYSLVVKPTRIRLVLTLAMSKKWKIKQLDVKKCIFYGKLEETVYMEHPLSFTHPLEPNYVCLLRKEIYGLKQAPQV